MQQNLKTLEETADHFDKISAFISWRQSLGNYVFVNRFNDLIKTEDDLRMLYMALQDLILQMDKAIMSGGITRLELNEQVLDYTENGKRIIPKLLADDIRGFLEGLKDGRIPRKQ